MPGFDFCVERWDNAVLLQPLTVAARAWLEDQVGGEDEAPWLDSGPNALLAVQPEYLPDLVDAMAKAGLKGK